MPPIARSPRSRRPASSRLSSPRTSTSCTSVPAAAIERAFELARRARLLLVVGSSLEVHPVAALPEETLTAGGRVAIVNKGPTPYDPRAEMKMEENAGQVLGAVAEELLG